MNRHFFLGGGDKKVHWNTPPVCCRHTPYHYEGIDAPLLMPPQKIVFVHFSLFIFLFTKRLDCHYPHLIIIKKNQNGKIKKPFNTSYSCFCFKM